MKRRLIASLGAVVVIAAACSSSTKSASPTTTSATTAPSSGSSTTQPASTAPVPGVTSSTITIGLVSDLTGALSSSFSDTPKGVQAYFNMINAQGGINGRKLQLISADTASTPAQGLTAAQSLNSRGVFSIINISGVSPIDSYRYMNQQGIPVVGECADGPEWSDPVNSYNMFSYEGCNGKFPASNTLGQFLKQHGVTKLAVVGFGAVPSSSGQNLNYVAGAGAVGIPTVYKGNNVPLTQTDFSAYALAIKSSGANGVVGVMSEEQDLAVSTALAAIGDKPNVELYAGVGYDEQTLSDPTTKAAAQGDYFTVIHQPIETNTPAMQTWVQELKQYGGITGIPGFAVSEGWESAAMLVAGLQKAGPNFTRQSFISTMHTLSGFTANGVLSSPINEATDWGQGPSGQDPNSCVYVVQLAGNDFAVQNNNQPYCGQIIPNSDPTSAAGSRNSR